MAAAASAKVRASRRDALPRGSDNLLSLGCRVACLALCDAHPRFFAGQHERNKYRLALKPRQKRAAIDRLLNLDKLRFGEKSGVSTPAQDQKNDLRALAPVALFSGAFPETAPVGCLRPCLLLAEFLFAACMARRCAVVRFFGIFIADSYKTG